MAHPRRFNRLPLLLLLAAGLGAGAACGSGSGSNGVASLRAASDRNADSDSAGTDDGEKTNPEEAMLAFARCMREHGVDMPDPDTSGGSGTVRFAAPAGAGRKLDVDSDTFQAANDACQDLLGDAGPQTMTPEQQQEMQDKALAFSRCMREHGVDMPDPTFGDGGRVMMRLDPAAGIDPSDPRFEAAQQACGQAFGPGGKPGGKGGAVIVGAPSAAVGSGGAK